MAEGQSTYKEEEKKRYLVEALPIYTERKIKDAQLGRIPQKKERWQVDFERLEQLLGENSLKEKFVKVITEWVEE